MKQLLISLLFLFPVITYPDATQSIYAIGDKYLTQPRHLHLSEIRTLFALDSKQLVPKSYGDKAFLPHSAFATIRDESQLMLLPVIDTATNQWAGYAIFTKENNNTLYLEYLIVGEKYQRKGIGTMIIDYLFKTVKPEAIKLKATQTSAAYYKKLGFINGPKCDDFYKQNPYLRSYTINHDLILYSCLSS